MENTLKTWNTVKRHKICIIGVPEGKERENKTKAISEKMID